MPLRRGSRACDGVAERGCEPAGGCRVPEICSAAERLEADTARGPCRSQMLGSWQKKARSPLFGAEARRELFHQRVLVLDGPLDDDNGTLLATQLLALAAEDAASDIALWIHSPGRLGAVDARDPRRHAAHPVRCRRRSRSGSRAARASSCSRRARTGKRRALPHARILMHQGSAGIGGSAVEVEVQADDLRHTRDTVLGLIAEDTGQPVERIFEDSLHDRWYTAQRGARLRVHRRHRERFDAGRCRSGVAAAGSASAPTEVAA